MVMKTVFTGAVLCAALAGQLAWSGSAVAQQKSSKECNLEWAASKAAIQATGMTKRAFVAECRGIATKPTKVAVTLAAGQFATEAEARASCPTDAVVWANLPSKIYHTDNSKTYGKT